MDESSHWHRFCNLPGMTGRKKRRAVKIEQFVLSDAEGPGGNK